HKLSLAARGAHYATFSNNGRFVAVGYLDGTVRVWEYETEKLWAEFTDGRALPNNYIYALAFSPDDTLLVAGDGKGYTRFYDVRLRRALPGRREHLARIWHLAFTPDGRSFATCSDDGTIKLWNVITQRSALTLRSHGRAVATIAFSLDGLWMASSGADGIRL